MLGKNKIIGAFERVRITKISNQAISSSPDLVAKIDTGAFSGVIHAENIQEEDGVLKFDFLGERKVHLETSEYIRRMVKNTHGGVKQRYLAKFSILLDGDEFEILLGLDDRSDMKFDILIGRAFLNKFRILVDPHKSLELDKEWEEMGGKQ